MIGDLSRVQKIYLVTGRTDMRKSFDGLMAVIRDNFQMDPFSNAVFLFCGRKKNTMKASILTGMDLYSCRSAWTMENSNGHAMLQKSDL